MKFLFRSVYALSQFGVQIIESVIFLLHLRIRSPNQGIENYKHFWLETISLLHLALLHLALSATPNVTTHNLCSISGALSGWVAGWAELVRVSSPEPFSRLLNAFREGAFTMSSVKEF